MLGIILLGLGSFFIFKFKQAKGREDMNEIMTMLGRGSFLEAIKAGLLRYVYGILGLIFFIGGLGMLGGK
jgi:hypothetical protein